MRVAVCDNNKQDFHQIIQVLLGSYSMDISGFSRSDDLLKCAQNQPFDLVILGIELPGSNGYDAALKLRSMEQPPLVIFLTNRMAYTLRGYGIAFRCLAKPIDPEQLHSALDSAIREIQANHFVFQIEGVTKVIPMEEIYFLEVVNQYTILHTCDQEFPFRATLEEILLQLPSLYFGMPHQSYVVNFHHVNTATGKGIRLTNGLFIPVSWKKKAEFAHHFHQYLGR